MPGHAERRVVARFLCILAAAILATGAHSRPAYPWRGVSLDVARHFFAPATIRRFIDLAARYRLNVVHLHLTDNEAWRLPSRRYPRLASAEHYTERQLRDLVAYARARGITVVPEIDLPAHAAAAIRAYPDLACGASDTLCPRTAAEFARNVAGDAMNVFPGPYIHTGGDELDGWTAQQRKDFERALDSRIHAAHRTMVVWDDEADAAPADALVEVWHLGDAAARARRFGHRVVIASDGPLYFDAVQGAAAQEPPGTRYMTTLEEVYAFSAPAQAFGVEAVVWSEYISSDSQLWYALLPREIAFGAVANDGRARAPWAVFRDRVLPAEFAWLSARGYAFRVPNTLMSAGDSRTRYAGVAGNQDAAVALTSSPRQAVALRSIVPGARIFYRTGTQGGWRRYAAPFFVEPRSKPQIDAKSVLPDGRESAVTTLFVRPAAAPNGSLHFDGIVSP